MARTPDPPYVLVIDDDLVSRGILGDALYRYGLVPLLASSGREAIDLIAGASAPVLIVLAFRLPDMPASELLAKLRADARWARARVLLTSALPRAYVPLDMRIDGFVQKPFDVESLLRATRAVMRAEPAQGRSGEG